ncbi:hypothetical protein BST27_03395 [Mycobacterium intermedium]|uniref:DUF4352 domain-containing protein n=1 Tax=Mycobacterium intermedium TaxID=28445 RepID=A0A1E3S966_MYCIE|nr:DUF4352 domain-containing protein [Mycobacterium intermedium]MCV6965912.1 DUF4352 domain-containing protein [Mycobacterium intermedium]ODQ98679.1 hypothetical protein BHQ20_21065 [Mycobacterium intermedium]OPE45940.1 hypothetical protein BV508_27840 [Mycobacterium intermedium]ORB10107.1 hypothetical protein BST27_03395 [Mycobacterium intermedium]
MPHDAGPSLSDEVRVGKFMFTVTAISLGVPKTGSRTAQGTFVIVNLRVRNMVAVPQPVYCQDQTLKDRNGRRYDNAVNLDRNGDRTVIQPGKAVQVKCAFDVRKDSLPETITLRDSQYTSGVTVSLLR